MTLFYFVVATFPLALYWLALAWLHGRSVPCAVSGRRDFIALCLALSGVVFIGPGQLLTTWGASAVWGKYVWALLAALEFLVALLIASNLRPRIVVYNADPEALRKTLTRTALELDDEACWSGAALNMPGLGVQFYLDSSGIGRVASLVQIGSVRSLDGWTRFSRALKVQLGEAEKSRRAFSCVFFAFLGLGTLALDALCFLQRHAELREAADFYLSI